MKQIEDNELSAQERRRYLRLDSVFPVQFRLSADTAAAWIQGFTNDISGGGLCLVANDLEAGLIQRIRQKEGTVSLKIDIPLSGNPVNARARVAWVKTDPQQPSRYLIGLSYEEIEPAGNERIMRYARAKRLFAPAVLAIVLVLGIGLILGSFLNIRLIKGNKALVEQLVETVQESSITKQEIQKKEEEKEDLRLKIQSLQLRLQLIEQEKNKAVEAQKSASAEGARAIEELNVLIGRLNREKETLQQELGSLQGSPGSLTQGPAQNETAPQTEHEYGQ